MRQNICFWYLPMMLRMPRTAYMYILQVSTRSYPKAIARFVDNMFITSITVCAALFKLGPL